MCKGPHLTNPSDGILLWVKASHMSKHQHSTRGFLTHAHGRNTISSGRKKKFTHKATPARCASHYQRTCCIFLGSCMLSFDTQRSRGVRDAPSHGNSRERVREEAQDRALTVKSIKQRAGIQPNGLHRVTTTHQWFAPSVFSSRPAFILQSFSILHGNKLT